MPLRLRLHEWRALLRWFVRGTPSALIAHETKLDRKRVLRALTIVRLALMRSVPANVRHVTDIEVSLGPCAGEGDRASSPRSTKPLKRRFATLGLYTAHGRVWAEVIPDPEADQIAQMLRERKSRQSIAWPGPPRYTGVVYRGRLSRLAESGRGDSSVPFGQIEAFWAYLQRQLRAKGGVRRERLGRYLAEYAWRYNHRKLPPAEQVRELLTLIRQPTQVEQIGLSLR